MPRKPTEFDNFPDSLAVLAPYGPYRAVISRITDGDTFDTLVDVGLNHFPYIIVRIKGINAPELFTGSNQVAGAAAKAYLTQLMPPGTPVVLVTERDVTTFGRYVASIRLADGRDVGIEMLNSGHAVPMPSIIASGSV